MLFLYPSDWPFQNYTQLRRLVLGYYSPSVAQQNIITLVAQFFSLRPPNHSLVILYIAIAM